MGEEMKKQNIHAVGQTHFVLSTIVSFCMLSSFLFVIDFVPELHVGEDAELSTVIVEDALANTSENVVIVNTDDIEIEPQVPNRITIDTIGLDTAIITPLSSDVDVLDRALVSGAVLYPESGLLNENANMLLFGHSSYLPVVHNKAYKAFNEIGKLKLGDVVTVYSDRYAYRYVVETVRLSEAEDVLVRFDSPKPVLTLATCNTFGEKQERWVVTATYVSKEVL